MDQRRNEQDQDRKKRQTSEPFDKEAIGGVTDLPEREPSAPEQEAVKGGPKRGG